MKKWIFLIIFGVAFGFVEAAVAFYLRQLLNYHSGYLQDGYSVILNLGLIEFINPATPILQYTRLTYIEMTREFSTFIMLLAVSYLSADRFKKRLGAFLITFAVWDFYYYIFLYLLSGWPKNIFDIDVYFLIPVPWVGPVITPLVLSVLIFLGGSYLYLKKVPEK